MRMKGDLMLQQATPPLAIEAEDCFRTANEIAREQGALSWELRIALSLARLRMAQGRQDEVTATLGTGLRSLHRRIRYAGSARCKDAAGRTIAVTLAPARSVASNRASLTEVCGQRAPSQNEVPDGNGLHLSLGAAPVELDRDLADSELECDLLVELPTCH